ncbi:MAG: L-2-amino-thiazoline-4-carboxylic acid hydrolase [Candidatus Lokiarchaeota archaeon]|nr:L-2-amino-thiazoline-4-carboxylic acid hydrolase [Candidatus Lokiarchaeota archaeon]
MEISKDKSKEKLEQQRIEYEKRLIFENAEFSKVISKELGKERFKEIYLKMRYKMVVDWVSGVAKKDLKNGRKNDIEGIKRFLWEPLKEQGFEFTENINKDGSYQYKITKCPMANYAKEMGVQEWTYLYHCMSDFAITEGYNQKIGFKRSKTIMQGDDYCDHYYYWKK